MLFDNVSSAFEVVQIVVSALIGLFGVAAALNGFVYKKIPMLFRLAMAAGGLCMMIPGTASDVVGLVMVGGIVLIQRMSARRRCGLLLSKSFCKKGNLFAVESVYYK